MRPQITFFWKNSEYYTNKYFNYIWRTSCSSLVDKIFRNFSSFGFSLLFSAYRANSQLDDINSFQSLLRRIFLKSQPKSSLLLGGLANVQVCGERFQFRLDCAEKTAKLTEMANVVTDECYNFACYENYKYAAQKFC